MEDALRRQAAAVRFAQLQTLSQTSLACRLQALGYTQSQWTKLSRFLEHPEVPAHNNRVENDIRPFAVGRRAWLFMDTQLGARASANLYSIVSTCRANGIEPLAYLTYLYEHLPLATTAADLEALLPWSVKPLLKAAATSNA